MFRHNRIQPIFTRCERCGTSLDEPNATETSPFCLRCRRLNRKEAHMDKKNKCACGSPKSKKAKQCRQCFYHRKKSKPFDL